MSQPTAVILIVGLNRSLLESAAMPRLQAWAGDGEVRTLEPVLPAVTCSVQASMLTGKPPGEHGIVGNGWYHREAAEIQFWKQSNRLVQAPKVWETAKQRDDSITCAKMFWWYNMYSSADFSVTPRPIYKADGRKVPDCYSHPGDLRDKLQAELGTFPLFNFWGPMASITSSAWIAQAARRVHEWHQPTLNLVYLPHLDYSLQKLGPRHTDIATYAREIDDVAGDLIDYYQDRGLRVMVVSEYGIEPVTGPVHINRALREAGMIAFREEQGLEMLDPGASDAFAVADHQVAHIYVRDRARLDEVRRLLEGIDGIDAVHGREGKQSLGLDHDRAGDLVAVADPGRWFTYYYWLDDARAPDFARTVDIHRKPGYDPVELFIDPALCCPKLQIAWKLLRKKLGFRQLMDVIPLDASLVKGLHGRTDLPRDLQPIMITPGKLDDDRESLPCTAVHDLVLNSLFSS